MLLVSLSVSLSACRSTIPTFTPSALSPCDCANPAGETRANILGAGFTGKSTQLLTRACASAAGAASSRSSRRASALRPWSYSSRRLRPAHRRHSGRRFALHTAQPETKRWRSHEISADICSSPHGALWLRRRSVLLLQGHCGRTPSQGVPAPGRPRRRRRALARSSPRLPACPPRRSSTAIA